MTVDDPTVMVHCDGDDCTRVLTEIFPDDRDEELENNHWISLNRGDVQLCPGCQQLAAEALGSLWEKLAQ